MDDHGIVLDIQRFSLHDGPGIRTTVFLKGCPLRCQWCHNPESWRVQPQLRFRRELCVGCGRCDAVCLQQVHSVASDKHHVRFERCDACGKCVQACATNALALFGRSMGVDAVMSEVLADTAYYKSSGGGMTVSGGEPLLQFDFLRRLLKAARDSGIHTCIETSGFADPGKIAELMELVDLFLFDIKHTDTAEHIRLTGVSNQPILENLRFLCTHGATVRLRCPIIPGINDTDAHIDGIASLTRRYPNLLGADVLPYHNMGRDKWRQIGKTYSLAALENFDPAAKERLLQRFERAGCRKVTMQ